MSAENLVRPRWIIWAAIAAVLAMILSYAPAMTAPFQWDDIPSIQNDSTVWQLWPPSVPLHAQSTSAVAGRPVVSYSLAVNHALNALIGVDQRPDPDGPYKTVGYHVVNVLLHLLCGALIFGVLRRTLRRSPEGEPWPVFDGLNTDAVALVVTALWLLHPIQSEAILYVVQRTEVLVSVCYVGTLYASIRAWDATSSRARTGWYAVAIVVSLLGMGSKEVMISAPLAVMLYDRAFRSTSWRQLLGARDGRRWFYPLLAATTLVLVALIASGPRSVTVGFHLGVSWYQYLYSQAWAVLHYIRLVFWPDGLTLDYGRDPISGPGGIPGLVVLGAFGIATIIAWTRVERWGWFGFVGAWFFLILAPSSSFVPIRTEIAAERRVYLPLVSVLVLLAIGVAALHRRAIETSTEPDRPPWPRMFRTIVTWPLSPTRRLWWACAGLCAVLAFGTFLRGRTYMSTEAMWRDVVAKASGNPRGYENLASVLTQEVPPRNDEAEVVLTRAIAVDSTYVAAWDALIALVAKQRRTADERALLARVLAISPGDREALDRMGSLLAEEGNPDRAIPYLERAVSGTPNVQALIDLGIVYAAVARSEDAIRVLQRAIYLDPTRTDALSHLGAVLIASGMARDAVPYLEDAVRRDPASGLSLARLGLAYAQTGRPADAARAAAAAVTKAGNDERVYAVAGQAMLDANRPGDAKQYLAEAIAIDPDDESSREELDRLNRGGRP